MKNTTIILLGNQDIQSSLGFKVLYTLPDSNKKNDNILFSESFEASSYLRLLNEKVDSEFILLQVKPGRVIIDQNQVEEWITRTNNEETTLSYSFYQEIINGETKNHPLTEYTEGSIRDDFNFGPLILFKAKDLSEYLHDNNISYQYAGLYDFRLYLSRKGSVSLLSAYLYTYEEPDLRKSGEKQFDYVNPSNRSRQIEMEDVATKHLKEINAYIAPPFKEVNFEEYTFEKEASVIIPVYNRAKTIADAIESVLSQKTDFNFNIIVVDNHSSDGTTEILKNIKDERLVHIIPERTDLGIGGCWNEGVNHKECGRFAVQLDSDDIYSDETTLQKIISKFRSERSAMVIGSYRMVNFKLGEIPPGIIDHREWTDDNGPNNALRINGLGAPRAFYTPIIRETGFPNVSYGEDYSAVIRICRTYRIGRIYEPVYLCRRWNENSDSDLSVEKINKFNAYKDSLRTAEIKERIKINSSGIR
jgi:hypothetical protein